MRERPPSPHPHHRLKLPFVLNGILICNSLIASEVGPLSQSPGTHGLPDPWQVCWCVWLSHHQQGPTTTLTAVRLFFTSNLATDFKINSKWIKDLNVRPKTTKLLEENICKTISDINHSRILYDPPPRLLKIKTKINKWDLIKIKSFCTTKKTISKVKKPQFTVAK